MKPRLIPAAAIALLLSLAAMAAPARPTQFPAKKAPAASVRPNVLLISIDTLRADHVGCYGWKQAQTPGIDSLASDGILFEHAIAQVPLTWPSHAAILTGTYPFQNGVQDFTGQPLSPRFLNIAQGLGRHGYATGAVVSAFVLDRSWGLARGFDFYDDAFSASEFEHKDIGLVEREAGSSVDHALTWLQHQQSAIHKRPFFFWLHLYDPHSPYDPPEPFASRFKDHLYDGEIAYADSQLARLFAWLKRTRIYDQSLIILVSDHGESLGDHGEREHGFFIYNSTVRVPLIVKLPARSRGRSQAPGSRVSSPVETIGIAPTIFELLGIHDPIEQQFRGRSLLDSGSATAGERTAYSETFYPFSSFGWSPLRSLESGGYHYIEAPIPELYNLTSDPGEVNNLAGQQPAIATVMRQALRERVMAKTPVATKTPATELSPDRLEKLRALGYLGYQAPVSAKAIASGLPDPKSKLWEFTSILKAEDDFHVGDFQAGAALLKDVEQKDPEMYLVPFMLGEAAMRQKQWPEAQAELEKCLKLNPEFDQAMTALARSLYAQGRDDGAKEWLQQALKQNPQNYRAWYELAEMASQADPAAAGGAFEKSLEIQPNFALARHDLGMLQYRNKDYGQAAQNLGRAASLGAADAKTYNVLGISYSQIGRLRSAVASYKKALQLDAGMAEAHLNLAYAYQKMGATAASRKEYGQACRLETKFCAYVPR